MWSLWSSLLFPTQITTWNVILFFVKNHTTSFILRFRPLATTNITIKNLDHIWTLCNTFFHYLCMKSPTVALYKMGFHHYCDYFFLIPTNTFIILKNWYGLWNGILASKPLKSTILLHATAKMTLNPIGGLTRQWDFLWHFILHCFLLDF